MASRLPCIHLTPLSLGTSAQGSCVVPSLSVCLSHYSPICLSMSVYLFVCLSIYMYEFVIFVYLILTQTHVVWEFLFPQTKFVYSAELYRRHGGGGMGSIFRLSLTWNDTDVSVMPLLIKIMSRRSATPGGHLFVSRSAANWQTHCCYYLDELTDSIDN